MRYISILCKKCGKPIGTGQFTKEYDIESGLTFYWHNRFVNDCAGIVKRELERQCAIAIAHAKQRRIK